MNILIITAARNEEKNLPKLYESLLNVEIETEYKIFWKIIENGSSDSTLRIAKSFLKTKNLDIEVESLIGHKKYTVGPFYSNLLADAYEKYGNTQEFSYIGVFDADIYFSKHYIKKLIEAFNNDKDLVLTSGKGLMNGEHDGESDDHVRGNARLWRENYIRKRKMPREMSPDSISKFHAYIDNKKAYPINAKYFCREMGVNQDSQKFYGFSAFYRGVSSRFALLKSIRMILKGEGGISYFAGFFENKFLKKEISPDLELKKYVRQYSINKVKNIFRLK